ncbi:MAG: YraN family protein [Flavobacteriaceae bacterium]|jgi:putative endonuclease
MSKAHELGKKAENLAASYLQKSGYTLLSRNFRYLKAEVDLIAQKENTLVAVEVKARTKGYIVAPHEAVSYKKIQLLVIAIDHFVQSRNMNVDVRFDIITYVFNQDKWEMNHVESAFYPFG